MKKSTYKGKRNWRKIFATHTRDGAWTQTEQQKAVRGGAGCAARGMTEHAEEVSFHFSG